MRKSTIWLAILFGLCLGAWVWKYPVRPEHIKERAKEWAVEISMNQLRNFLAWRNPEAMLLAEQEERERLIAAEQQSYAILAENRGGKLALHGAMSGGELQSDPVDRENTESGGKLENMSESAASVSGRSDSEGLQKDSKESEKTPEDLAEISENLAKTSEELEKSRKESEKISKEEKREKTGGNGQKAEKSANDGEARTRPAEDGGTRRGQAAEKGPVSFPELVKTTTGSRTARYTWKQLTDFDFLTEHFYQINSNTVIYPSQLDGEKYLKKNLALDRSGKGPQILIYHTHGSEYFKDSDRENPQTLITGVGDELTRILEEKYGYRVYHDTTVFPYSSSYSLGREKVKALLKKYPDIQVVIDLHRDSAPNQHLAVDLNGKKTAQIMFFNGMSQTKDGPIESRKNENLKENLAFSLQLKLAAEQLYPGFARKNFLKPYRYNMDLAGCYTLIECGAETNTLEEELNAMEPLAEILHCVLQ